MIAKIDGTNVIADSQCVIISNASSIAISAENRRSDIHTHGMTPPTSVVAVNVTAIPEVAIARLIGTKYERRTPATLTRLEDLLKDLRAVRKAGIALDREEHTPGICAAGIVLRDLHGNHIAISVPVPAQRFAVNETEITERLLATKRALEERFAAAAA